MKKLFILILLPFYVAVSYAQNDLKKLDDVERIAITAYVDPSLEFSYDAKKQLLNKMDAILLKQGIAGSHNQRFIITAKVDINGEDIIVTTKEMYQYELGVHFVVGDGIAGTKFAVATQTVKGLGETKAAAYMTALKKIKPADPDLQGMLSEAKERIIEYYNTQCEFIMKEAMSKADRKEFDEAIYQLLSIPTICKDCYDKAQDVAVQIYKRKIENDCQLNISQAKAAIAANDWDGAIGFLALYTPDLECYPEVAKLMKDIQDHRCADALARAQAAWASRNASEAAEWLAEVSADSKCYSDAQKLQKEIAKKLDADEKREWDFKLKQQKDATDIEKAAIKATRDIGVAYGNHQQPVTYNIRTWW